MRTYIILLTLAAAWPVIAQVPPPPAATQGEVNAGTLVNKYVSPATLAGWTGAGGGANPLTSGQETNLLNAVTNNDTRPITLDNNLNWAGVAGGNGAGLTNVPVAAQNLAGIFTNVTFLQTNGPGLIYATNGGTLTVFIGVNTNVPNITTNGLSANGQVPIATNVAPYYFWGTLPSGGGGSGGTVWQNQSGAVNANVTLNAGEAEVPIITGNMSGAVGHGGRVPWNTPMTVSNFCIRFETSPAMTNGQAVYVYFVTNGVEDRSFIVAGQGYGSADTCITSGTATYSYVPQGTNPVISLMISNSATLNNCQYTFRYQYQ